MDARNKVLLDFKDNPELREVLGAKQPGETCTLELTFQVESLTDEGLEGRITKVGTSSYHKGKGKGEGEKGRKGVIEPSEDEPIMVQLRGKEASY